MIFECRNCSICLSESNWSEPNCRRNAKICKKCHNLSKQNWAKQNREKRAASTRLYVENNPEKETNKKYYDRIMDTNPESAREKCRKWARTERGHAIKAAAQGKRKANQKSATPKMGKSYRN